LPLVLAITWSRTNTIGFVGGVVLAIAIGMPLRGLYGELYGTLSILAISGGTVILAGLLGGAKFESEDLELSDSARAES
jgi:hypothetical protein